MLWTNRKAPGMTRVHTGATCEGKMLRRMPWCMLAAHDPLQNPPSIPPSLCTFLFYSLPFPFFHPTFRPCQMPLVAHRYVCARPAALSLVSFGPETTPGSEFIGVSHFHWTELEFSWLRYSFRTFSQRRRLYWLIDSLWGCTFGQFQALLGVEDWRVQQSRVFGGMSMCVFPTLHQHWLACVVVAYWCCFRRFWLCGGCVFGLIEFLAMGRSAVCGKSLCVTHTRIVVRLGFAHKKELQQTFLKYRGVFFPASGVLGEK